MTLTGYHPLESIGRDGRGRERRRSARVVIFQRDRRRIRTYDDIAVDVESRNDDAYGRARAGRRIRIRERERVSQPVFARHLNTSESTVEKWESGAKKPSGMALKLLDVVEKHGLKVLA